MPIYVNYLAAIVMSSLHNLATTTKPGLTGAAQ